MQHTGLGGGEVRLNLYTQCSKKRENSTKTNLHAKDDIHHNFDYSLAVFAKTCPDFIHIDPDQCNS